jgi:molybdate transport system substrate-binding protein
LSFVIAAVLALPAASSAQVNVLISGGFSTVFQKLLPEFEKTTGITVTSTRAASQGSGPNTIGARLRRGVLADVVIMSREGLEELAAEGRIVPKTDVDLARAPLGVGVRAGAPKPDISTVDGFKRALLRAKSINSVSTTGLYITNKLLPQLGIASEIAEKIKDSGVAALVSGESELAILPVSELLHVQGVDFVGPIPEEIQHLSVFTAAMVTGSKKPEASKRLIAFLASENARTAITESGMEPSRSRQAR